MVLSDNVVLPVRTLFTLVYAVSPGVLCALHTVCPLCLPSNQSLFDFQLPGNRQGDSLLFPRKAFKCALVASWLSVIVAVSWLWHRSQYAMCVATLASSSVSLSVEPFFDSQLLWLRLFACLMLLLSMTVL